MLIGSKIHNVKKVELSELAYPVLFAHVGVGDYNNLDEAIEVERNKIKLPAWSKLLLILLFINFTLLEIFISWVTIQSFQLAFMTGGSPDFTPLVTLISLVIGETIGYGIYCAKSKAENTEGGIVYDTAMYKLKNETEEKEEADG